MSWLAWLLVLFIFVPAGELFLLGRLSAEIGFWYILLLVLVTGVFGAVAARWQGLEAWRRIRRELRRGQVPTQSLLEGVAVLLGCAFLVTPGVITDAVGLLLFVPAVRGLVANYVRRRVRKKIDQAVKAGRMRVHFHTGGGSGVEEPPGEARRTRPLDDDSFTIR